MHLEVSQSHDDYSNFFNLIMIEFELIHLPEYVHPTQEPVPVPLRGINPNTDSHSDMCMDLREFGSLR